MYIYIVISYKRNIRWRNPNLCQYQSWFLITWWNILIPFPGPRPLHKMEFQIRYCRKCSHDYRVLILLVFVIRENSKAKILSKFNLWTAMTNTLLSDILWSWVYSNSMTVAHKKKFWITFFNMELGTVTTTLRTNFFSCGSTAQFWALAAVSFRLLYLWQQYSLDGD
jgi:hypothetical protein